MFVCGFALLQPAHSVCVVSERFFISSEFPVVTFRVQTITHTVDHFSWQMWVNCYCNHNLLSVIVIHDYWRKTAFGHSLVSVKVWIGFGLSCSKRSQLFCWFCSSIFMHPPLIGGGIKRCFCLTSDLCLTSVCLSRISGLTREQRGLGRLKLTQRYPTSHVTRTPL